MQLLVDNLFFFNGACLFHMSFVTLITFQLITLHICIILTYLIGMIESHKLNNMWLKTATDWTMLFREMFHIDWLIASIRTSL